MKKDGTEGASGKLTKLLNTETIYQHRARGCDFEAMHADADEILIECLEAAAAGKFTKDQAKSFLREYKRIRKNFHYA